MMALLTEPFGYDYMINAMWVSALVGGVCAFLSAYLMLKGWSLIGDALAHAIVPGVVGAYMLGLSFSAGAFLSGLLAAAAMLLLNQRTRLKEDVVIGVVFSSFFGLGLFMASLSTVSINMQTIIMGNILAITPADTLQLVVIASVSLLILTLGWKALMIALFDENHARSVGIHPGFTKGLFFVLLAACTVAAMQTVGGLLVVAMVITPGATAYLLTDQFVRLLLISVVIGVASSFFGAYFSYFLDGATGGVIVVLQALVFIAVFVCAPKHGLLAARRRRLASAEGAA